MRDPSKYDPNAESVGEIIQGRPTNQTDTAQGSIVTATTIADVLGAFDALLKASGIKGLSGEAETTSNSDILTALNVLINKPTSELAELMTMKLKQESTARGDLLDQQATKVEEIKQDLTTQIDLIKQQETERASYCKTKRIILQDRAIENETDIKAIQEEIKQIKEIQKGIGQVKQKSEDHNAAQLVINDGIKKSINNLDNKIKANQEDIKQISTNKAEIKQIKKTFNDHNAAQLVINDSIKSSIKNLDNKIVLINFVLNRIDTNKAAIERNNRLIESSKSSNQFTQSQLAKLKTNVVQVEQNLLGGLKDYAVGTTLLAYCNKQDYDPNDNIKVFKNDKYHSNEKYFYDFSVISGTVELAGSWRCRGFVASGSNNSILVQRIK